jgi:hypothetical protein
METKRFRTCALLYNDFQAGLEFLHRLVEGDQVAFYEGGTRATVEYENGDIWQYILCEATWDSVASRFCAENLSGFSVTDQTMYCGKALLYVASRVRDE